LDGQIWALKADSLTSPLIVTVIVTVTVFYIGKRGRLLASWGCDARASLNLNTLTF